jgi:hypothetical protein
MRSLHLGIVVALGVTSAACGGTVTSENTTGGGGTGGAGGGTMSGGAGGAGGATTTGSTTTSTTDSTTTTTTTGPDIGQPSDKYPAPHPAFPKVVDYGGPTLATPKVQPIFFSNDDPSYVAKTTDFTTKVGATKYWAATTSEYGVGPLEQLPPVQLMETATGTIDDAGIQAWLAGKLNANDPQFAPPDDNTIYAIIYPAGFVITEGGQQSCQAFGGYHSNLALDAAHNMQDVPYIVLPRCADFGGIKGIDAVTAALSHELIEAVTDPLPMSNPAYATTDNAHVYWVRALGGGEVGDMCAQNPGAFTKFDEIPYMVQRSWSNQAAAQGHDPCQPPVDGQPYFNAAPVMTDTIAYSVFGQTVNVKGVKIPVGQSKTIEVDLFSDGPTNGPFSVHADDFAQLMGQQPHLEFAFDASEGQNGQKLHMTITVDSAGKKNSELFYLVAEQGNQKNLWVGVVGQ